MDAFSFTLILTTAIFGATSQGGNAISTTQVTGFATYEDCMDAGKNARIPADRNYAETDKVYSCVKVKA
ncbi:hypothetical protein pf16_234 [Pseudomonas phage pf16]|uniref:Uncharacterized protein n=1 Tax=Pseudomonas phage pf16 TaxID=1815630 RepID=A0A1S5R414_9CAUD|nr:hypothetical protein FDG98_gp064 [Pseudomonas phage pf16]AND75157.1 hypothetical protein pf16_234 [Pseudomonas phage pf16]